jgi:biopolymer transport protein ExbB
MVGLLGTTVGMMHTFMEMRSSLVIGGVKPAAMASGIFEAMVTTVAGLIIAIIATSFYAYFRGVVQRIITNLEEVSTQYAELIEGGQEK